MRISFSGFFFFFKQKTAYEIKECDWSSDVCSSDLDYGGAFMNLGIMYLSGIVPPTLKNHFKKRVKIFLFNRACS